MGDATVSAAAAAVTVAVTAEVTVESEAAEAEEMVEARAGVTPAKGPEVPRGCTMKRTYPNYPFCTGKTCAPFWRGWSYQKSRDMYLA